MVKTKTDNLRKNFIWNIIGSSCESFSSLFFMIIVTRINGVNEAGIFTFAFSTACLFYIIGVYSGRSYQVTENDKKISDSDYFYGKIFTCILMLVFGLLFCFIKSYNAFKFIIILLLIIYKLLEAFSEYTYAVIQKKDRLFVVGQSLLLKSVVSLLLFLIVDLFTHNLILAEMMIILTNLIFIFFFDFKELKKEKFKLEECKISNVINILKLGFFTFAFSFLNIYVINAQKYAMDGILANKYQTIFGIIVMPATVLILLGQFVVQPYLVKMKETLENDVVEFKKMILKMSLVVLIIGLFGTLVARLIGIQIFELLYGINLKNYVIELVIIMFGATFYGMNVIFSTALITMRKTFVQLLVFLITTVVTFIISPYFININRIMGASMAYLITMSVLLGGLILAFIIEIAKYKKVRS